MSSETNQQVNREFMELANLLERRAWETYSEDIKSVNIDGRLYSPSEIAIELRRGTNLGRMVYNQYSTLVVKNGLPPVD